MGLSEKEQALYDFIKERGSVDAKAIENLLGVSYVGALGRLVGNKLVEGYKERINTRYIKHFRIKEK